MPKGVQRCPKGARICSEMPKGAQRVPQDAEGCLGPQKMPKGCPSGAQLAPNGAKRCQNGIHLAPIWRPQTLRSEYKKSIIISPGIIVFSVDIIHCSSNDHLAPICPPIGSQMAPRKQIGTHLATFLLPKVAVQMYRRHVNLHFYSRKDPL